MKISLYDKKILEFPKLDSYEERKNFIEDNVLNKQPYCNYYNLFGDHTKNMTKQQTNALIDRWLGIKVVGKTNKSEHLKGFLDYLTGYMLNSKDVSEASTGRRYYTLYMQKELDLKEKQELETIEQKVLHKDINMSSFENSLIFIVNTKMENMMKLRVEELRKKENKDFSEEFILKDIVNRLDLCELVKQETVKSSNQIKKNTEAIKGLYKKISNKNEELELNKESVFNILQDVGRLKQVKEDSFHHKVKIKEYYEQYYIATELSLMKT